MLVVTTEIVVSPALFAVIINWFASPVPTPGFAINILSRFVDATPLEILKELGREAFEQGSASRQAEINQLKEQSETYEVQLAIEKQKKVISDLEQERKMLLTQIQHAKDRLKVIKRELSELSIVKMDIDNAVKSNISFHYFANNAPC